MAIIGAASFDAVYEYSPREPGVSYGNSSFLPNSGGRTGKGLCCGVPSPATPWVQIEFPALTEAYFQFCYRVNPAAVITIDDLPFASWGLAAGGEGGQIIYQKDTNTFNVYKGPLVDPDYLLGSSSEGLNFNGLWSIFEIYVKLDDTVGRIIIRKDWAVILDFTGNNRELSDVQFSRFRAWLIKEIRYTGSLWTFLDDLIVQDTTGAVNNSWPGGKHVSILPVNGAGNSSQWTPSVGQNYQCVDDSMPSMADFVRADTAGLIDTYAKPALPLEALAVTAVRPIFWGCREGLPTINAVKPVLRIGGVDYPVGDNLSMLPGVMGPAAGALIDVSPATTDPFTVEELNAAEIGMESEEA